MLIYHALSYYQTLACLVHSYFQEDSNKIIFIGQSIKFNLDCKRLEDFFEKVIFIDIRVGLGNYQICQNDIDAYFKDVFEKNHIVLDDESKIYAGGCHYNFGVYLALNHIPFYYMEEACGLLSRAEHVRGIDRNNRTEVDLIDELGLYDGTNESICGVICNIKAQRDGYDSDKMIDFDVLKELAKMSSKAVQDVMYVFGNAENIAIPENSVVVLSQHYANLNMMTYERQALLYGLVFDYFLSGRNVIVKKHPADIMAYTAIYPEVAEIKRQFLSEFIPFIMKPMPQMAVTISSTGIVSLKNLVSKQITFDFDFENNFESIHKVYTALRLLSFTGEKKVSCIGINERMLCNLLQYSDLNGQDFQYVVNQKDDLEENTAIIIDDIFKDNVVDQEMDIEKISLYFSEKCSGKTIIFINSDEKFIFHNSLNHEIWDSIIPVPIRKINLNRNRDEEMYNDFTTETIYLFSQDKEVQKKVMSYSQRKELAHLQMDLTVDECRTKEQLRISVLEGMLAATEKRLLYYMKMCREQKSGNEKNNDLI